MEHPGAVVMRQRFEQRIAHALRQLQGLAIPVACTREVSVGNGQVGQGRQTHQTLAVAFLRQAAQRFATARQGTLAIATATGNHAAQG
ncbi:hypothetical protein D3C72_1869110 [compost metagenome]